MKALRVMKHVHVPCAGTFAVPHICCRGGVCMLRPRFVQGDDVAGQTRAKKEQRLLALLLEVSVTYSMMLETTPEPTVRPPSRIAKRSPCSMAIGVISLIVMRMLSPGMTISTPSGSSIVPVTSVVRK